MLMSSQPTTSLTVVQNVQAWQKGRVSPGDGAGAPGCSAGTPVCSAQVWAAGRSARSPRTVAERAHAWAHAATGLGGHTHTLGGRLSPQPRMGHSALALGRPEKGLCCHWDVDHSLRFVTVTHCRTGDFRVSFPASRLL